MIVTRYFHRLPILLLVVLVSSAAFSQEAAVAHRRTVDELVDESAYIIHGRVMNTRVEPHPELKNLNTILVTMQVQDVLKGDVPANFSFRQFVWDVRQEHSNAYKRNQELLLFLRPPSKYGLTSPAGLSQGRFTIRADARGNPVAVNGENNLGLFKNLHHASKQRGVALPAAATGLMRQDSGPIGLQDLKSLVRALASRSQR
jgi:hypothetical protein